MFIILHQVEKKKERKRKKKENIYLWQERRGNADKEETQMVLMIL